MDKLRSKAEQLVQTENSANAPPLTPEAMQQTLHELRVHQVELELQNEELRRSHADLDAVRMRYFDLYDLAPVGYCTINPQGLITESNLTAASLLGVPRSEMIGVPWTRFIFKADQDIYYRQRKILLDTMKAEFDLRMLRKGEPQFWVHISATITQEDQALPLCRIVMNDISERKQEEQFRENVERIIHHDIKTPLVNLFSLAEMVMEGVMNETVMQYFPQIMLGIRQVVDLIDASEALRKMERGEYTVPATPVNVLHILNAVKQSVMVLSAQSNTTVEIRTGATYHSDTANTCGEAFLLESMFMNLVKNAVEASPQGERVLITCQMNEDEIRISVHNVGEVPESIRDRFFEKNITSGKVYGTGLGTYSAQLIAKSHGGHIELVNSDSKETTITVSLPRYGI